MSDIFISYAKEDRQFAETLAQSLGEEGFDVWWDHDIPTGSTFDAVIEKAIKDANCVIVLWSENSINSEWVRIEAAEGKERNILIPILIADVEIPFAFRRRQTADLCNWSHGKPDPCYDRLISDIQNILGRKDRSDLEGEEPIARKEARSVKNPQRVTTNADNGGIHINKKHIRIGGLLIVVAALFYMFSGSIKGFFNGGLDNSDVNDEMVSIAKSDIKIGDLYEGGIVFQVDANGESFKVCSERDLGSFNWYDAKKQCDNYTGGGFTDWYLPSKEELNLIFTNLMQKGLGNFRADWYWSSTETDGSAWEQEFPYGIWQNDGGGNNSFSSVRAVRTVNLKAKKIGDIHAGGIIFQLDPDGQHGKVCTKSDLGKFKWEEAKTKCEDLILENYSDWYLPSKEELDLIHSNLFLKGISGFSVEWYWSSSTTDGQAWEKLFDTGVWQNDGGGNESYSMIRAVRKF